MGTNEKVDPAFQSILAMQETRENVMQMPNVFTLDLVLISVYVLLDQGSPKTASSATSAQTRTAIKTVTLSTTKSLKGLFKESKTMLCCDFFT